MRFFRKTKVLTLSEWLEIATRKLAESAKERIRAEIEAHYAEAVEGHREDGVSKADAETAALAELGDPNSAGRRFRRRHLTKREAEWLKKFNENERKTRRLSLVDIVFYLFIFSLIDWSALAGGANFFL